MPSKNCKMSESKVVVLGAAGVGKSGKSFFLKGQGSPFFEFFWIIIKWLNNNVNIYSQFHYKDTLIRRKADSPRRVPSHTGCPGKYLLNDWRSQNMHWPVHYPWKQYMVYPCLFTWQKENSSLTKLTPVCFIFFHQSGCMKQFFTWTYPIPGQQHCILILYDGLQIASKWGWMGCWHL